MTSDPSTVERSVADRLIGWQVREGRSFPWHAGTDSFQVLIAEILLRQTRADSVPTVLATCLKRFPTPAALASAVEDEVVAVIETLGFGYQRARQLRALAAAIEEDFEGVVPQSVEALQRLPGVGRYTAAIVAATCYGTPAAAVDTNVARVVSRIFDLVPSHAEARKSNNIWNTAERIVAARPNAAARLTWAMVDLAAGICTVRMPRCRQCPLLDVCLTGKRLTGGTPGVLAR
jgi:A/G-specific adenine glycosylase